MFFKGCLAIRQPLAFKGKEICGNPQIKIKFALLKMPAAPCTSTRLSGAGIALEILN